MARVTDDAAAMLARPAPPPPLCVANSGDVFLAVSHASLRVGHGFFTTEIQAAADAEFRNDTLDAALASALAPYQALVAVAAARVH